MQVVEKFISINGEGQRAGEPAVFLRFKGCNLRCSWCDTMWANEADCPYTEQTPQELAAFVSKTGVKNVTLTGGEPLLQREMPALLEALSGLPQVRIEIETNGAAELAPFAKMRERDPERYGGRLTFTMDYKLPSSGMEEAMRKENLELLQKEDTLKFVSASAQDLERALQVIREYDLERRCHVYFSPVFGAIEPVRIVDVLLGNGLCDSRLQLQLHKFIWDPEKRGV